MKKKISIAIDAMGGDNSPGKTIAGIKIFLDKYKTKDDFILNIFGKEKEIKNIVNKYKISSNQINIINSNYVVSDKEKPLTAVKNSKNTSMWDCIQHQLDGKSDISLSAGNTGVLLVISRMILKMINDVNKPALAGLWPNENGMNVVLDLGANIECNDQNLVDFAELGSALFKSLFPNEKPKVSLLNVGSEEMKGTEMLKIASRSKPPFICIVPEKRKEITTEGGLNLNYNKSFLKLLIKKLKKNKSRISLFIEPSFKDIVLARKLDADCVEIHTGKLCNLINKSKNYTKELKKIQKVVKKGNKLGLEVHAGHGLTYSSAKTLSKIKGIQEFNIGHFLIGESIFEGMPTIIRKFKKILKS